MSEGAPSLSSRRWPFASAGLVLTILTSACIPLGARGVADIAAPPTPAPSQTSPDAPTISCPPKPVEIRFQFAPGTSPEDRGLIQEAMESARAYYPLRFKRSAVFSTSQGSYQCQPKKHTGRITTTTDEAVKDEAGIYTTSGIRLYMDPSWWPTASSEFKYRLVFHEAYHWYQNSAVETYATTDRRKNLLWMVEGSARWAEYDAAVHFGKYSSMYAGRANEASLGIERRDTLPGFEQRKFRDPPPFPEYPLFFTAVDFLVTHHGGRAALRRYWEYAGPNDSWRNVFMSAFGISVKRFYTEFAAA